MSDKGQQKVLVVPSAEFDRLGRFQGFHPVADRYLDALLVPELVQFLPRSSVEDDPSFKQIIPYVILAHGDRVFCYLRGKSQGEARLHRLRSLGVGGHIEDVDADGRGTRDAYEMAMRRELEEEVEVAAPGELKVVGLINDDSNEVGQVHLGVVHWYELEKPEARPREEGLADAEFLTFDELLARKEEFETWSKFCIEALIEHARD
jgi:predicted NUDIX family phosphoesterase